MKNEFTLFYHRDRKQKQNVIAIANEDAKVIIDTARKEIENESAVIMPRRKR
jgi:hypothetical protein